MAGVGGHNAIVTAASGQHDSDNPGRGPNAYNAHYFCTFERAGMNAINVTELRQHLPEYLKQVQGGEEVVVTLHGKPIARIVPDRTESMREAALKRLESLRGKMIVGDILAPLDEEWNGDADHL